MQAAQNLLARSLRPRGGGHSPYCRFMESFGLKGCRQRVQLMVWREDAWTLDGFRGREGACRFQPSQPAVGLAKSLHANSLAPSLIRRARNTNMNSLLDDWAHLRDYSRQQNGVSRTLTHSRRGAIAAAVVLLRSVAQSQ